MAERRHNAEDRRHKTTEDRVFGTYVRYFNLLVAFHEKGTDFARAAALLTLADKLEALGGTIHRKPS